MKISTIFRILALTVLLSLCSFTIPAEYSTLKGRVCGDDKKPLANVEVVNANNNFVAYTDAKGNFALRGKKGDKLSFTLAGTIRQTITATGKAVKIYLVTAGRLAEKQNKKAQRAAKRAAKKRGMKEPAAPAVVTHDKRVNTNIGTVTGQVTEYSTGIALPGATVMVKGTGIVAVTDIDGNYGINAKNGNVLVFSFIGFETAAIKVDNNFINVQLRESSTALSEVVVTGYGTNKRSSVTGVVSGVSVATASPGAASAISIRGASSIASPTGDVPISNGKDKDSRGKADKVLIGTAKTEDIIKAGQLTAGEINDFSKWAYWEDLTKNSLHKWQQQWQMAPSIHYSVQLLNDKGYAIVNRTVHLREADRLIAWTARTDNTGRAELWYRPQDTIAVKPAGITITDDGGKLLFASPKEFHEGTNTYTYKEECQKNNKVNIAFMVDATGSMGDEISYLQAELCDVIERTKKALPDAGVSMGSTFYRDAGDAYVVKNFDFTKDIPDVISFIKQQSAGGGGDYPEAVVDAFEASINDLAWEDDAAAKLLFVVLDAPPHETPENIKKLQALAAKASEKGIRIIPLAASGIDKSTEYLMRALALQTNGTYLFITNHSGIGDNHIEPSTDSYRVELLNDMLLRVILQYTEVNSCETSQQNLSDNSQMENMLGTTEALKWSYYPNPASGLVTVDIDDMASELLLFDTTGKLVLYRNNAARQYTIDLTGLPTAIYYLKVMVNGKPYMGKIIKKS